MKLRRKLQTALAVTAAVTMAASLALAGTSAQAGTPVGDHWVDNLGSGTTASQFNGNTSSDCTSETFLAADYDLWHFVVNGASDASTILTWNADNSVWSNPEDVDVVDVTSDYGDYTSGDGTKHLWIATTPTGATLNAAYLDYAGTAGRENLSHACGRAAVEPGIRIDPTITYDTTWEWDVNKDVVWMTDPQGGYTLSYAVYANRSDAQVLVPDSLHITGGVIPTPSDLDITGLTVTFTQGTYVQDCAVVLATLHYDCTLDVERVSTDPDTGWPTGTGTLSAVATYAGGTLTDSLEVDFVTTSPDHVYGATATINDDNATPSDMTDDRSTTEDELDYTVTWNPTGTECVERTNTAVLAIDDPAPGTTDPSDSVTVRWCPPMPGRTIGYWGNKMGAPMVLANIGSIRTAYPNVSALIPSLTTAASVRNFLRDANCSGDCSSMFAAQFLAVAMNALDGDFADQGVMVGDSCMTVSEILEMVDDGATGADKYWYSSVKSLLDDINNSRQTSCLTVTD